MSNTRCYKCNCQLSAWTSATGGQQRVPGSEQDAKAARTRDKKAKEQRDRKDKDDAAAMKCLCCGGKGHMKSDCRQADKACNNCGKTGHLAHVCRSKATSADVKPAGVKAAVKNLAEDAFAEEAARRGWLPPAAPVEDKTVIEIPPSTATLIEKHKAVDAKRKTFDLAVTKVRTLRESLAKADEALTAASDAVGIAELELQKEVALVCPLPKLVAAVPLTSAKAPAIDIQQFLLARDDPKKLQELVVFFGEEYNLDNCGAEDRATLEQQVGLMKTSFMAQIKNVFPANFLQELDALSKAVDESKAKKRKGPGGEVAQASLPSNASTANVNAAAEAAKIAADEATALQQAADVARRAEEKALSDATAARRAAEADATLLAHNQELVRLQAVAKAEAEAKQAQEARDKEAKALTEKHAKDAELADRKNAEEEIATTARLATQKRLEAKKRGSSQPPAGGQPAGCGAKKLQIPPGTLAAVTAGDQGGNTSEAPTAVASAELAAPMVS